MSSISKQRVFTTFEKLSEEIKERIKLEYPFGFSENLISFYDKDGMRVSALRFETEEKIYLVKRSVATAERIVEEDNDYDSDGNLKQDVQDDYYEKYQDIFEDIGKDARILDCSCGTGLQIFGLAQKGYKVWGSDISKGMLKRAREYSKQKG